MEDKSPLLWWHLQVWLGAHNSLEHQFFCSSLTSCQSILVDVACQPLGLSWNRMPVPVLIYLRRSISANLSCLPRWHTICRSKRIQKVKAINLFPSLTPFHSSLKPAGVSSVSTLLPGLWRSASFLSEVLPWLSVTNWTGIDWRPPGCEVHEVLFSISTLVNWMHLSACQCSVHTEWTKNK